MQYSLPIDAIKFTIPVSNLMALLYQDILDNDIDGKVLSLEDRRSMENFDELHKKELQKLGLDSAGK